MLYLYVFLIKGTFAKSGSESSLSDAEDAKESVRSHEEKGECSDNESSDDYINKLPPGSNVSTVVLRKKSRGNPLFRKSEEAGLTDTENTRIR